MESNDEFKKIKIKNHTSYYFGDIIKPEDFDFDSILTEEKSHENILAYNILYKILISAKTLRIRC